MMVLAVKSDGRLSIPPLMNRVLCDLFEGLRVPRCTWFRPRRLSAPFWLAGG
jgi:hypothetical protein